MGVARGVRNFKQSKKRSGGSDRETFALQVKDGEEARVRFTGMFRPARSEKVVKAMSKAELRAFADECGAVRRLVGDEKNQKRETTLEAVLRRMEQEEPVQGGTHWAKGRSFFCAEVGGPYKGIAGCVSCRGRAQSKGKSKVFTFVRDVFGFSLWDYRQFHKIERDGEREYKNCTSEEGRCKLCSKAKEDGPVFPARMTGNRKWVVGRKWATAIISMNESLAKKCRSCKTGRIKNAGYVCGNPKCGEVLADIESPEHMVRCPECTSKTYPKEEIECTKCDNPVRGSLGDVDVLISRAGSGKDDTTYNFVPQTFEDFEHGELARPVDWSEEMKPPSTSEQAAKLGLDRDPFGGGRVGGDSWDEDDEDSDDDDEDEKSRKKTAKKPVKKSSSRDDDDEDADDDEDDD